MSHPIPLRDIVTNTSLLYYQFHGEEQLHASLYSKETLTATVNLIRGSYEVKEAFIFFNNDIHAYAITNEKEMKDMAVY